MAHSIEDAATAPDRPDVIRATPARLGRYKIERVLGEGGMGVVYTALDPDLERRVALKVLRGDVGGDEARKRLLREARAMARLQHPNVVMVHEVGTTAGLDFVAMELVEGETLADWLRTPRSEGEILETFQAAGRGLAAAHAAGIVHRDFKPGNVLLGRNGRVQVTDFGLARGLDATRSDPMAATLPPNAAPLGAALDATPNSLSGLTSTGLVLGTPAYMAPEQWINSAVSGATDQFAFCVALWEALAGRRPFGGTTEEELRVEVLRGPLALDASKLPRRLRPILLRGLEPKPAKRWPSMDALLHELRRVRRRPYAIVGGLIAVAAAGGIAFAMTRSASVPGCRAPARDPQVVWPANAAAPLGELGAAIDRDVTSWSSVRGHVCDAAGSVAAGSVASDNAPQLNCLDAVLARIDAVAKAAAASHEPALAIELVDPQMCTRKELPHLVLAPNADVIAALAIEAGVHEADDAKRVQLAHRAEAIAKRGDADPCARALALVVATPAADVAAHRSGNLDAMSTAERCGDDHVRALVAIDVARFEIEQPAVETGTELARRAATNAIDRIPQSDFVALREMFDAAAARNDELDRAIAQLGTVIDALGTRGGKLAQLEAALVRIELRGRRGAAEDVAAIRAETARWLPSARSPISIRRLAEAEAAMKFVAGDIAGAHAELADLRTRAPLLPDANAMHVDGIVVDRDGRPVAGATVAAADILVTDSLGIFAFGPSQNLASTTTGADGRFAFDAPPNGGMMALHDAMRSPPINVVPHPRLVLGPTRTLAGKIDLGTTPATRMMAAVMPGDHKIRYELVGPVAANGAFSLSGAPVEAVNVTAMIGLGFSAASIGSSIAYPAGTASASDLVLAMTTSDRHVTVIVRSTLSSPLEQAMVVVAGGRVHVNTLAEGLARQNMQTLDRQLAHAVVDAPKELAGKLKPGDLVAEFEHIPPGENTACALGLSRELMANGPGKMFQHANELELRCFAIAPDARVVVVQAPPPKRFD